MTSVAEGACAQASDAWWLELCSRRGIDPDSSKDDALQLLDRRLGVLDGLPRRRAPMLLSDSAARELRKLGNPSRVPLRGQATLVTIWASDPAGSGVNDFALGYVSFLGPHQICSESSVASGQHGIVSASRGAQKERGMPASAQWESALEAELPILVAELPQGRINAGAWIDHFRKLRFRSLHITKTRREVDDLALEGARIYLEIAQRIDQLIELSGEIYDPGSESSARPELTAEMGLDPECVELVNRLNSLPGICTLGSCCGHGKREFFVTFLAARLDDVAPVSWACLSWRHPGWKVEIYYGHRGSLDPHFALVGPQGDYAGADAVSATIGQIIVEGIDVCAQRAELWEGAKLQKFYDEGGP